jgi:hypothetical protein
MALAALGWQGHAQVSAILEIQRLPRMEICSFRNLKPNCLSFEVLGGLEE